MFERWELRQRLAWIRPAYVALIALVGALLRRVSCPSYRRPRSCAPMATWSRCSPIALAGQPHRASGAGLCQSAARPARQACIFTGNYGEASALIELAPPDRLPPCHQWPQQLLPWGPGTCTAKCSSELAFRPQTCRPATRTLPLPPSVKCPYCVSFEQNVSIVIASNPKISNIMRQWVGVKHYD